MTLRFFETLPYNGCIFFTCGEAVRSGLGPVGVVVGVELIRWIPPRYVHVYVHVEFTEVNYEVQFYFPF